MNPMTPEELSRWFRDPGALDVWEDIAAWFHKETGHLRPGKDKPPGFHDTAWGESDCCMDAWVVWRSEKQDAAVAGLRARNEELEMWISRDGLSVLIEERDRYREALELIVNPGPGEDTPDPDEIAKEVLRLKSPALGCLKCFPGEDCPEDCLDRNHRVTDN